MQVYFLCFFRTKNLLLNKDNLNLLKQILNNDQGKLGLPLTVYAALHKFQSGVNSSLYLKAQFSISQITKKSEWQKWLCLLLLTNFFRC